MVKTMSQVKFTIDSGVVSAFKSKCAAEGVSMTSAIRQFMMAYRPTMVINPKTHTRQMRRKTVMEAVGVLNDVLDAEAGYRDCIPEQFALRYEAADHACAMVEEAVACLEDAY